MCPHASDAHCLSTAVKLPGMILSTIFFLLFACGESAAPPEAAGPTIEVETVAPAVKSGGDIESVLATNRLTIETCYRNALRENATVRGRIEFEWLLADGQVTSTQVVSTNFPEDYDIGPLAQCILESSKNWRFPQGDGAVRYPITFSPSA